MTPFSAVILGTAAGMIVDTISNINFAQEAGLIPSIINSLLSDSQGVDELGSTIVRAYLGACLFQIGVLYLALRSRGGDAFKLATRLLTVGCISFLIVNAVGQSTNGISLLGACNGIPGQERKIEKPTRTRTPGSPAAHRTATTLAAQSSSNALGSYHSKATSNPDVYICRGPHSERYHHDAYCRGLRRCSTPLDSVSLDDAQGFGRTICGFED